MKGVCFVIDDCAAATCLEDDEAMASEASARPKFCRKRQKISGIIAWAKARVESERMYRIFKVFQLVKAGVRTQEDRSFTGSLKQVEAQGKRKRRRPTGLRPVWPAMVYIGVT